MNFVWRNATKEDCLEFNKWGELAFAQDQNEQVKQGAYNINRYLNADRYGGLGVIVRQYISVAHIPKIINNAIIAAIIFPNIFPESNFFFFFSVILTPLSIFLFTSYIILEHIFQHYVPIMFIFHILY